MALLAVAGAALGLFAGQSSMVTGGEAPDDKAKKSKGQSAYTLNVPIALPVIDGQKVDGYLFFRYSVTGLGTISEEVLARALPAVTNEFLFNHTAKLELPLGQPGYLSLAQAHETAMREAFPAKLDEVRVLQVEYFPSTTGRTGLEFERDG